MSTKKRANITTGDLDQLYLSPDGIVHELVGIEPEPKVTMRPISDGEDTVGGVSEFHDWVRLIPETEVARRKKVVAPAKEEKPKRKYTKKNKKPAEQAPGAGVAPSHNTEAGKSDGASVLTIDDEIAKAKEESANRKI